MELIPVEVWTSIFNMLNFRDLYNLMQTCKIFYKLINKSNFFHLITRNILWTRYPMTLNVLRFITFCHVEDYPWVGKGILKGARGQGSRKCRENEIQRICFGWGGLVKSDNRRIYSAIGKICLLEPAPYIYHLFKALALTQIYTDETYSLLCKACLRWKRIGQLQCIIENEVNWIKLIDAYHKQKSRRIWEWSRGTITWAKFCRKLLDEMINLTDERVALLVEQFFKEHNPGKIFKVTSELDILFPPPIRWREEIRRELVAANCWYLNII